MSRHPLKMARTVDLVNDKTGKRKTESLTVQKTQYEILPLFASIFLQRQ